MEIQPPKDWSTSHGGSMRRVVVSDDLRQHAAREAGERAATVKVPTPQSPMKTQALANTFDVVPKLDETRPNRR